MGFPLSRTYYRFNDEYNRSSIEQNGSRNVARVDHSQNSLFTRSRFIRSRIRIIAIFVRTLFEFDQQIRLFIKLR